MIDIKILREKPQLVKENCQRRKCTVDIDLLINKDQQYRKLVQQIQNMRNERNNLSKQCRDNPDARQQVKELKTTLTKQEKEMNQLKTEVDSLLSWLPNFLAEDVPNGDDDDANQELRIVGNKPKFTFKPLDHQELGEKLNIIDTARGAKVAQRGFYYWKGKGAMLANALFFWVQRELVNRGFTLFTTPCAAKEETLFGTGYLPFFADQTYKLQGEDLSLIGTSEQTLIGYHGNETLPAQTLPAFYTSFSPCFRTEAGSYGKDVRGIFRVHQFHKVEQVAFCLPEDSPECHRKCLENEEYLLQQLGLTYRVVNVCVGDLGAPGYKKFDIEAWFAGHNAYREVTSNTNLTDFQSRRLGIKYKDKNGKKGFVHTISATAVTDRVVCAIMENFQQEDNSIIIPEVLRPFTGFDTIEPPKK